MSLKRITFWLIPTILLFFIKASRNFKDFLKFLEKYSKLLSIQPLPRFLPPLKFSPSTLPWNWRVFKGTLETPLKFRGFSRVPLKNPWNVLGTLDLDWPLKFNFKVEEPWNSRPQLPSLIPSILGQFAFYGVIRVRGRPHMTSDYENWTLLSRIGPIH